jgi:hypothetical protein
MKSLFILVAYTVVFLTTFVLIPAFSYAQTEQAVTASPPLSQPLVREGTLAIKLADDLNIGKPKNEAEAESMLNAASVAPLNGWIADYPVTPDIIGELQSAVSKAAESGKVGGSKEAAQKAFQDVISDYNLSVKADTSGSVTGETPVPNYPDSSVIDDYYYTEGPPVVTYYTPPPDYAYLYTWVPYPFWGWNFWFPGFFVLVDFDVHGHGHGHGHGGHGEFVSNHFRDPWTGGMSRIDPANRSRGGTFPNREGAGWSSLSARNGAQAILNRSRNLTVARGSGIYVSSLGNGRVMNPPSSRHSAFMSSSGARGAMSSTPVGRTYGTLRYSGIRTFGYPAYRASGTVGPSVTASRSFNSSFAGRSSFGGFSGGGRGSFAGRRR